MNRTHAAAVLATAAALGTGVALAGSANATQAHAAAKYTVLNCAGKPVAKPANWTPFCADYGVYLTNMHWTSWTGHSATGYGTVAENDNYPSHARGKIYHVPGLVTLCVSARWARQWPSEEIWKARLDH